MRSHILTAIDIGTNSIKLLVGEKKPSGNSVTILVKEETTHFGSKKGEVYNPETVAKALSFLIEKVHKTKGIKIKKAVVNINGPHLFSLKSQGLVSVSRADQKISREDLDRVIQACQAVNLPSNKEIIEAIPLDYIVDNEAGVKDPIGLEGVRLEAKALLICVFSPVLENLETAVAEAGIEIEEIVPSPIAASRAVLSREQKELGAVVMDIGAGATVISVWSEGNIQDFAVFPMGSANITNDIAIGLRIEIAAAEKIKKDFAALETKGNKKKINKAKKISKNKKETETIDEQISFSEAMLRNIVRLRTSEIFFESAKMLKKISKEIVLPAGVVLTGGGASLSGLRDFAKEHFELPVYISGPKNIENFDDCSFSTVAGLLLTGFDSRENEETIYSNNLFGKFKKIFSIFLP